jgi:hypothetical protein
MNSTGKGIIMKKGDRETRMFLIRHANTKLRHITFDFASTLEEAQTRTSNTKAQSEASSPPQQIASFQDLHKDISLSIERQRGLRRLMVLFQSLGGELSYATHLRPVLEERAVLESSLPDRDIYSFDLHDTQSIFRGIQDLYAGVAGLTRLPRLLLIGLIGQYDVFLQTLIRVALANKPEAVGRIKGTLTASELVKFASINMALEHLIDGEIDAILRQSHAEQLESFGKLFNVEVTRRDEYVKDFLEICERRNVLVHNDGIANSTYLDNCRKYEIDQSLRIGERLQITTKYLDSAIETVQELKLKLCQYVWRKLAPEQHELADSTLNEVCIQLLHSNQPKVAAKVLHYALKETKKRECPTRLMMLVNYANALKLSGNQAAAIRELDSVDWLTRDIAFRISVSAVRGEIEQVTHMMTEAAQGKSQYMTVPEIAFRDWPVFTPLREHQAFRDEFKRLFKKNLIVEVGLDLAKPNSSQITSIDPAEVKPPRQASRRRRLPTPGQTTPPGKKGQGTTTSD